MNFVHPAILWFLPLAAIPVIIYYLLRFRSLKVTWGANYVLERALEQLKRKLRLDQILLMALRIGAIALIVFAFARPTAHQSAATVTGSGVHHVVIFDASYSMAAGQNDQRRIDMAKQVLGELLKTWGRGEIWSLCVLRDEPTWVIDGQPVESIDAAMRQVEQISVVEATAPLGGALEQTLERFSDEPFEVYIFADDQANTWQTAASIDWPGELDVPVYWINPPLASSANVAVTGITPSIERPLAGHPQRVAVQVRSFADRPLEDVGVELLLDGAFLDRRVIALVPGQSVTVDFDVTFDQPASHYLTAQIATDALDYDNRMFAAVEVPEQLNVVVLRQTGRTGKFESAWGFFETVANADRMAQTSATSINWTLATPPIEPATLAQADVIYIDGGVPVDAKIAAQLRRFVQTGGGVVLAVDGSVNAVAWNSHLGGAGLLPASLGRLYVEPVGGSRYRTLAVNELPSSELSGLETGEAGDLTNAQFFAWRQIESLAEDARVLARFDDRQPWALVLGDELGRSLLLTAGLSGSKTNVFVREFYLPLVYRLFQAAAEGADFPRTVRRGRPVRMKIQAPDALEAATFGRFGEAAGPVEPRQTEVGTIVEAPATDMPSGLYTVRSVRGQQTASTWFAVQGPRVDSDLTPMTQAQQAAAMQDLGASPATDWAQLDEQLRQSRRGREWYTWVAIAVGLCLLGEMLVQRRFVIPRS